MNIEDPEAEVEAIMNSVDYNNSGTIDYTGEVFYNYIEAITNAIEFVIATINRKNLLSKNRLDSAFKMFDKVKRPFVIKTHNSIGWKWIFNSR